MKFLVDENMLDSVVRYLSDKRYDVVDIKKSRYKQYTDQQLALLSKKLKAVIVTFDKDFVYLYKRKFDFRVIRFELVPVDTEHLLTYLQLIITKHKHIFEKNCFLVIVRSDGVKIIEAI